jgi:hypothetical protein
MTALSIANLVHSLELLFENEKAGLHTRTAAVKALARK